MEIPGNIVAGPFHPAFRSLVDASIFRDMASSLLSGTAPEGRTVAFTMSEQDVSDFRGHKNENLRFLTEKFQPKEIQVTNDPESPRGWLTLQVQDQTLSMHRTGLCPSLS
ncbi:MAG: hypothetical protein A4E66_02663 [Syntrophus sp. PtaB.Bin001]|nr:MAG: hypothetical protein A4E66_02663 [Syntrophus sp. PtaB.Bin001]